MNRVEFMTELEALLRGVPEEERREAIQFYNDYFDDAGADKEQEVIAELGSPKKVADRIKADIPGYTEYGKGVDEKNAGHADYTDYGKSGAQYPATEYEYTGAQKSADTDEKKPWTNNTLKVILIIAIIIVGVPTVIPVALGIVGVAVACVAALFIFFLALVVAFAALAIVGVVLAVAGLLALIPEIAVGLALLGTGLILGVIGVVGTVASVRLCIIVFPGIIRGIVWVCRKPFHREAVS